MGRLLVHVTTGL